MNLSVTYTKTNSVADDCIKSNMSIGLCHWLFVFHPQFWSDETLLGRKTSVPTSFLLIGHLGGQHVDWRLQKGSMFLYLWNAWDVIFLEPACCCFTSMSVSVLLCYSGTLSWRRTSWRVINLLWFDQGQLEIKLRVWQDNTVPFMYHFVHQQHKLAINTICAFYRKSHPSGESSAVGNRTRGGRPLPWQLYHPH